MDEEFWYYHEPISQTSKKGVADARQEAKK